MELNLFAEEEPFNKLRKLGDHLERLNRIEWEKFSETITKAVLSP